MEQMTGNTGGNGKKTLVVFYSRTGNVAKVAEEVARQLGADVERIIDRKDRSGIRGWFRAGSDSTRRIPADIEQPSKDPGDYDLVIIGSPIWNKSITTPVRAYVKKFQGRFPEVAFFINNGFNRYAGAIPELEGLAGKKPAATMAIHDRELKRGGHLPKIKEFVEQLAGRGDAAPVTAAEATSMTATVGVTGWA
jgi:flavodoxin